jgi:hypothetical protein
MTTMRSPTRVRATGRTWRAVAVAVFVALHGIAHFVGTTGSLDQARNGSTVDYLGGLWPVTSPAALRVLAVVWALVGACVIAAAVLLAWRPAAARPYLAAALGASLVLSVLGLWASVAGVAINLVLLGLVWWAPGPVFGPRHVTAGGGRRSLS